MDTLKAVGQADRSVTILVDEMVLGRDYSKDEKTVACSGYRQEAE
jgi:hypothetical protein